MVERLWKNIVFFVLVICLVVYSVFIPKSKTKPIIIIPKEIEVGNTLIINKIILDTTTCEVDSIYLTYGVLDSL